MDKVLELKESAINYQWWDIRECFIEEVASRMGLKELLDSGLSHGYNVLV